MAGRQEKDESLSYKQEFLRFCQTTTIRGVSRIVNSRNKGIRSLWLTFVICLYIGLFTCMILLASQYFDYDVIHPPRVLRDTPSPFPSLTLCNLRPLSPPGMKRIRQLQFRDPRDFAKNLNEFAAGLYFYRNRSHDYELVSSAISMGGYLESLPKGSSYSLGHLQNETVIQCMVLYLEGSSRIIEPCEKVGRWRHFFHALYLNCHSFDIDPSISRRVLTIELFSYLNERHDEVECHDCFASEIKSQLSGAVVVVHTASTYPDVNQEGINLQPGTLTEIKIKAIENIQKEPPYGRCTRDTPTEIPGHDNMSYAYSEYGCRMYTIQAEINENCNCNAIEFPIINNSLPFCMSMVDFVKENRCVYEKMVKQAEMRNATGPSEEFLTCEAQLNMARDRILCKALVMQEFQGDVVPTCTLPCAFYSYETDRSTSTWPTKSWQLTWLSTDVGRTILEMPEMVEYRRAVELLSQPDGDTGANKREVLRILEQNNAVERNLLAIIVVRSNFNLHKVAEKEVFSLTSFLSQTGGLLSIWIGLTMICVVEVLELIINCVFVYKAKKNSEFNQSESPMPPTAQTKRKSPRRGSDKVRNSQKEDEIDVGYVALPISEGIDITN
ncbi:hypothetical protein ECG_01819 [Echinococcus granulosus]|uniref:FMRFamide activated amiloride sensitive sodium n=1 Tax=Echinococcus granulosus TaxID=6210 RepID=A0A068W7J0_ECHGR|nr:hypothetical protein ECG_01819 [Echinococcus granulosus]CDS15237.1 FMRFamide activated amiloride sensitive sodium [Echinococcus granulosus]